LAYGSAMSILRTLRAILIVCSYIAFCAASSLWLELSHYVDRPAGEGRDLIVMVSPGRDLAGIAAELSREGVIRSPLKFRVYARIKGLDRRIKAGEYLLSPGASPEKILKRLVEGHIHLRRLTIPEGLNLRQIAALVERSGLVSGEAFLAAAADPALIAEKKIPVQNIEGYVLPETYYFPKGASARELVRGMIRQFDAAFPPEWRKRAAELGLTLHQVVTLASIIEKETGAAFERTLISSVFHNRLRLGMRLQSDPTVIYGVPDFEGSITRKHLRHENPYNTYRVSGLPPGPIASPGLKAIEAALYPEETPYLYFVSRNDGTHVFSTSLEAHNQAVRTYQR
jgi:UPF0755 protein